MAKAGGGARRLATIHRLSASERARFRTSANGSTGDRSSDQTAYDVKLNRQSENEHREFNQSGGSHQRAPLNGVVSDVAEYGDGKRFGAIVRKHKGEQEVVPRGDERQDGGGSDSRGSKRGDDSGQHAHDRASVDERRLFDFARH